MIGKKVYHPKYGSGEIVERRYKGLEYLVLFQLGFKKWVRFDEIQVEREDTEVVDEELEKEKTEIKNFKERSIIEALRLGIVPYRYIEEFVFGRNEEIAELKNWLLQKENDNFFFIIGEYGSGKSHLIRYIEALALNEGFATSLVELDLNETPFFKPKKIYRSIVNNFKYLKEGGKTEGFRSFVKEALNSGYLKDHPYFKYLKEDDETLWEWIEAKDLYSKPYEPTINQWGYITNIYDYLPPLSDYATYANVYCNLISTLSWVAQKSFNLKGLLIIFDEAESIKEATHSQQEKSFRFLNALYLASKNDERLLYIRKAEELGFDLPGNSNKAKIPYIYEIPFNLKIILAFTYPFLKTNDLNTKIPYIILERLPSKTLEEIFWYTWEIYKRAYNIEENYSLKFIFDNLLRKENHTRLFIKGVIEAFDLLRFGNKNFIKEV